MNEEPQCHKVSGLGEAERNEINALMASQVAASKKKIQTVYHYGGSVYQDLTTADVARRGDNAAGGYILTKYILDGVTFDQYGEASKAAGRFQCEILF